MSLLLNALKKAEDGEKDTAAEQQAATPGAAGAGATPTPGAAPVNLDLDALDDEPAGGPAAGGLGADAGEKRQLVGAARIFKAGGEEEKPSGGGLRKLAVGVVSIGVVFGGGYAILKTEVIPGFDLSLVASIMGTDEVQVVQEQRSALEASLQTSEEVLLLPIPAVDVQAEVDFASLNLPRNSLQSVGEEQYKKNIAILTGYDVDREEQLRREEELSLQQELSQLNVDANIEETAFEEVEEVVEEEAAPTFQTADASRNAQMRLNTRTISDNILDIRINGESAEAAEEELIAEAATGDGAADATTETAADAGAVEVAQTTAQEKPDVQVEVAQESIDRANLLERARKLYHSNSYAQAEALYRSVLHSDRTNVDALRGLALIAVATGRYQMAAATYLQILQFYPNDPVAMAEMANLRSNQPGELRDIEAALKEQLGKGSATTDGVIYFALGNLYAENGRWVDAQRAYFDAFSSNANNPDYAYNLAVMLDYLNKPTLAARYYQSALDLSEGLTVGFGRAEVQARIKDLATN